MPDVCRTGIAAALAGCALVMVTGCGAQHASAGVAGSSPENSEIAASSATASRTPSGGTNQPVPWVSDPASPYTPPVPPPPTNPAAQYPACTAAQLSGHAGGMSMGMGSLSVFLVLTNTGTAPCTIADGPSTAVGILADGSQQVLGVTALQAGAFNLIGPTVNLRPGQSADAIISGGDEPEMCPGSRSYRFSAVMVGVGPTGTVRVRFPGSRPSWTDISSLTLYTCGSDTPYVLGFGIPAPTTAQPPSPLDVLQVSRSMPATVPSGGMADYTVTLTNSTGHAVALGPCPSYAEFMVLFGHPGNPLKLSTSYYYLNCQAAPQIPAHSSVTFDMEIHVPGGAGTAKYGWRLQGTALETGGITMVG